MENIVQIQYIISAFIGFVSAVIVAIIAGIFQLRIAKKNREIQEKQLEESRNQFFMQMEKSQKEYAEKIEQLREEQRKANLEKANDKLQAETNRFYEELKICRHIVYIWIQKITMSVTKRIMKNL